MAAKKEKRKMTHELKRTGGYYVWRLLRTPSRMSEWIEVCVWRLGENRDMIHDALQQKKITKAQHGSST